MTDVVQTSKDRYFDLAREAFGRWHAGRGEPDDRRDGSWLAGYVSALTDRDRRAHETPEPRMPLEHYRTENGKLRKALADLMKRCPRCRAEAKEAMSEMIRKGNALQQAGDDELAGIRDAANAALTCDGACRYDEAGLLHRDPECSKHGTPAEETGCDCAGFCQEKAGCKGLPRRVALCPVHGRDPVARCCWRAAGDLSPEEFQEAWRKANALKASVPHKEGG